MAQAASDKDKNSSWLDTLATAAAQLGAGQALAELRTQASELVSEVRRAASEAAADVHVAEERAAAAGSAPSEIPAELSGKIDALTSSLEEVADLLDAGLERLETVEMQLGDPDDSVDARLRSGIESCQRRLGGIEQQMRDLARAAQAAPVARAAIVVLVVDGDCRRRCDLCVTLEHRGLHTLAAGDAAAATHMLRRRHADAILVRSDAGPELAPAIEAAAGEDAAPARLVLTPWPRTRQLAAVLHEHFRDWLAVTDAHGVHAMVEHIQSACSGTAEQPSYALPEQEETKPDAPL